MVMCSGTEQENLNGLYPDPVEGAQLRLEKAAPIASKQPGWVLGTLGRLENMLPAVLKPKKQIFSSFKNRVLFSTGVSVAVVVVMIGIMLQLLVFPQLKQERSAILHLKVIHFLASVAIIVAGWVFVEFISKKITLPLMELTKRADEISREAGESLKSYGLDPYGEALEEAGPVVGDEITHLTSSFNRMLVHLKASEARLKESEEKYRFIFDHAPTPIFVIDAEDMRILDVNARAEEEYQFSREKLLTMSFADLGLDRDRKQTASRLQQLYSTEATLLPVMQHRRSDGSLFMVNYQTCLSSYRNRPAVIAAVWDVTERLEKYARLIQAGKMATLGEMATGIAHELNQPLYVVKLGCDFLNKKIKACNHVSKDDLRQVTTELNNSVERASKIINHLRQFGRKADNATTALDINMPIRNVFNLLGSQLQAQGIAWCLDLADNPPRILGDSIRLEQIFINLILNAKDAFLKYDKSASAQTRGKNIAIKTLTEDDRLVVTVADSGPGIPASIRDKVFEPFFTTKKTGEGTGLGLSISYGIIKEHNGTIEIVTENKQGTTFRLTFPALKTETDK
jgi:PAS domain S-box-containing protein